MRHNAILLPRFALNVSESEACRMDGLITPNGINCGPCLDDGAECAPFGEVCGEKHVVIVGSPKTDKNDFFNHDNDAGQLLGAATATDKSGLEKPGNEGEATLWVAAPEDPFLAGDIGFSKTSRTSPVLHSTQLFTSASTPLQPQSEGVEGPTRAERSEAVSTLCSSPPATLGLLPVTNSAHDYGPKIDNNAEGCGGSAAQFATSASGFKVEMPPPPPPTTGYSSVGEEKSASVQHGGSGEYDMRAVLLDGVFSAPSSSSVLRAAEKDDAGSVGASTEHKDIAGGEHDDLRCYLRNKRGGSREFVAMVGDGDGLSCFGDSVAVVKTVNDTENEEAEKGEATHVADIRVGLTHGLPPTELLLDNTEFTKKDIYDCNEDCDDFGDFVALTPPLANGAGFINQGLDKGTVPETREQEREGSVDEKEQNDAQNSEDEEWAAFTHVVMSSPQQTELAECVEKGSRDVPCDGDVVFGDAGGRLAESDRSFVFGRDIDIALLHRRLGDLNVRVPTNQIGYNEGGKLCTNATEKGKEAKKEECRTVDDDNKSNPQIVGQTRGESLIMVMKALSFRQRDPGECPEAEPPKAWGKSSVEHDNIAASCNFSGSQPRFCDDQEANVQKKQSFLPDTFRAADFVAALHAVGSCKPRHRQSLESVLSQGSRDRKAVISADAEESAV